MTEALRAPFGTFGTPSGSVFGEPPDPFKENGGLTSQEVGWLATLFHDIALYSTLAEMPKEKTEAGFFGCVALTP